MSPGNPAAESSLTRAVPVFAALGDKTRLEVVARLCARGPLSIRRLTEGTGVSRQAVTKHLQVLARGGLVQSARRGRERVWSIEPDRLDEARRCLVHISQQWDQGLQRLKLFVEEDGGTG
jgi:DNA-binding transcriptional ArsR family regulator